MKHLPEVYVQGINVRVTENELREMFEEVGHISVISILPPSKPGQSTTFGFVGYRTIEECQDAVYQFSDVRWNGRVLGVRLTDDTRRTFGLMPADEDEKLFYDNLYDDRMIMEKLHINNNNEQPGKEKIVQDEEKQECVNCSKLNEKLSVMIKSLESLTSSITDMKEHQDKQILDLNQEVKRLMETNNDHNDVENDDIQESGEALVNAYMVGYQDGIRGTKDKGLLPLSFGPA